MSEPTSPEPMMAQHEAEIRKIAYTRAGSSAIALRFVLAEIDTLRARLAEAEKDRDRLDWIETHASTPRGLTVAGVCSWSVFAGKKALANDADNLRAALDAAREERVSV
jgi:hypothetical protein